MAEVEGFAEKYSLESTMLMDPSGEIGRLYQLRGTPTTFFVDKEGIVLDIQIGFVTQEWIRNQVATYGS